VVSIVGSVASLVRLGRLHAALVDALRLVELLMLAPRGAARRRMLLAWLRLRRNERRHPPRSPRVRVRWTGRRGTLSAVVSDSSELRVIHELFSRGEYDLPDGAEPRVIVDLGSNVGISVLLFADRYPGARIVAVEPQPAAFALLCENTAHLAGVQPVHAAMGDRDGEVTLHSGRHSWASSTVPDATLPERHTVPAMTLDTLAAQESLAHIGLLKMDIEGAEGAVLASPAVRRSELVLFEFHREHAAGTLWDLLAALPEFEPVRIRDDTDSHPLVTLRRRAPRGG
jgi:FkbM family methyltransferase